MTIAVDFDGTIVENKYPQIGKEIPFAIETLKKLADEQHRLILWTVREGKFLEEAVSFNVHDMLRNAYLATRAEMSEAERKQFYDPGEHSRLAETLFYRSHAGRSFGSSAQH